MYLSIYLHKVDIFVRPSVIIIASKYKLMVFLLLFVCHCILRTSQGGNSRTSYIYVWFVRGSRGERVFVFYWYFSCGMIFVATLRLSWGATVTIDDYHWWRIRVAFFFSFFSGDWRKLILRYLQITYLPIAGV